MSFFIRAAALVHEKNFSLLRERAGLQPSEWNALPCIVGSSSHGVGLVEDDADPRPALPVELARGLAGDCGVRGPLLSTSSACTSGLTALQLALDLMHAGEFRRALVLGVELPNRLTAAGFRSLGLGMKLGAAVGALLVSREGPWKIAALAWRTEVSNLTGIHGDTVKAAMEEALARAGWHPADVDLVKLHADADAEEARALGEVFPKTSRPKLPKTTCFRNTLGHTLGASGPAELALLLEQPRPERRILFNLSGFGGQVASMALERTT